MCPMRCHTVQHCVATGALHSPLSPRIAAVARVPSPGAGESPMAMTSLLKFDSLKKRTYQKVRSKKCNKTRCTYYCLYKLEKKGGKRTVGHGGPNVPVGRCQCAPGPHHRGSPHRPTRCSRSSTGSSVTHGRRAPGPSAHEGRHPARKAMIGDRVRGPTNWTD